MKISISGKDIPADWVSVDTHRFGQATAGPTILPYTLSIDRERVLHDFQKFHDDYVADTATHGTEDDEPVARTLEALKFPSWPELLDREPTVAAAFLAEVAFDFLNAVFSGGAGGLPHYFIRTVDRVAVRPDSVGLTGLALDYRQDLLNQIAAKMPEGTPVPRGEEPGFMSNYDIPDED